MSAFRVVLSGRVRAAPGPQLRPSSRPWPCDAIATSRP